MHTSTSVPVNVKSGRARLVGVIVAAAVVIAAGAWALTTYVVDAGSQAARQSVAAQPSVLATLSPQERQYVKAIAALTPAQIAAAFGTAMETEAGLLASLSPKARQYVEAIAALTPAQLAAAFGTDWETSGRVLASLSPQVRRYVQAIAALTPRQIAAAFGTAGESAHSIVLTPQQIEQIGAAFGTGR
jgi:hypothetical protein